MACSFVFGAPLPALIAGGAEARPDHPILGSGVCIAAVEMMLICVGRGLDPCSKPPLGPIKAFV